jgi:3-methylcrotonyl-CoA carboxylase alpha subunit
LIKAVAGGGGKGMRRVDRAEDFAEALAGARREALAAFGNDRALIEKFIDNPRHVEIQVFADAHGNVVHLNERDCSLQRRHQKVIEEAPAPGMTPDLRAQMGAAAVAAARAVGYVGAGTVEFIVDGAAFPNGGFWFMEMNTRLQVEHPVTEAITGIDLVAWQFRVAAGEPLPLAQADIRVDGHAVEARLCAEDPSNGFLPSTGKIWALRWPADARVDAGVEQGGAVSPHYDPMIAKIIAHGATRDEALDRLSRALGETIVAGPRVNAAFLKALCDAPDFRAGHFDTGFIGAHLDALGAAPRAPDARAIAFGAAAMAAAERARLFPADRRGPWDVADGFEFGSVRRTPCPVVADGVPRRCVVDGEAGSFEGEIETARLSEGVWRSADGALIGVEADGDMLVLREGRQTRVARPAYADDGRTTGDASNAVVAPMHGKLAAVFVLAGERVRKGQRVAVVEAMKMEHALVAPLAGVVAEIRAREGAQVAQGAVLMAIDPDEGAAA